SDIDIVCESGSRFDGEGNVGRKIRETLRLLSSSNPRGTEMIRFWHHHPDSVIALIDVSNPVLRHLAPLTGFVGMNSLDRKEIPRLIAAVSCEGIESVID